MTLALICFGIAAIALLWFGRGASKVPCPDCDKSIRRWCELCREDWGRYHRMHHIKGKPVKSDWLGWLE
jgi:predicted RNA-binding Zn-ribbon protein involved in translation (DUF1610 family)